MGDSDEEYDRRRARDKFRRERSDYQERRDDRGRRDDWNERDRSSRRDYRDYDPRNRRDRYSPVRHDISPPMKRMRRDWDDRGGYGGNYDAGFGGGGSMMGAPPAGWGMHQVQQRCPPLCQIPRDMDVGLTQPPMMTFKQFLASQDDGIDDQEAVKKYNEYKLDFRRQQINDFFLNHKDEEWFKTKYHPEESTKRQAELAAALKRRLDIFMDFYEKGMVEPVRIDQENSADIIKFLDAVVIKLEGGTDFDLKALDEDYEEEQKKEKTPQSAMEVSPKEEEEDNEDEETETKVAEGEVRGKRRKSSRDSNFVDNDESSAASESDSEADVPVLDEEKEKTPVQEKPPKKIRTTSETSASEKEEEEDENEKVNDAVKDDVTTDSNVVEKIESDDKDVEKEDAAVKEESEKDEGEEEAEKGSEDADEAKVDEPKLMENGDVPQEPRPRALHKTCSIFLRYLAPSITKQEVEAMCKRFPGFLRVAIADPQPERRFVRRAWVTFEKSVNIKEMCWNLNGIQLRDNELGAIVNRDLSRRIRSVNGITSHKQVVMADIKLAARIIQNLDRNKKLWDSGEDKEVLPEQGFLLVSKNPLLKNITDYLIEEASAEEEELLGVTDQDENKEEEGLTLERDEALIQVLDRLLLYLRVVHSVDYYNSSEYPSEDEMPNRCGIMHARGSPPSSKVLQPEITDYIAHFEQKSQIFLQTPTKLDEEESVKLGKKDPEIETEKFIQANTQELSKEKWLCPLSGKKFKGPEFVRKHIFNKHGEKIEEVKKEVEYFNSYLMDPKRPQLPEHPSNRPASGAGARNDMHGGMAPMFHGGHFGPPPPHYGFGPRGPSHNFGGFGGQNYGRGPDMYRSGGGFGKRNNYQRRNPRSDPRKIITYRDLDAPNDTDVF